AARRRGHRCSGRACVAARTRRPAHRTGAGPVWHSVQLASAGCSKPAHAGPRSARSPPVRSAQISERVSVIQDNPARRTSGERLAPLRRRMNDDRFTDQRGTRAQVPPGRAAGRRAVALLCALVALGGAVTPVYAQDDNGPAADSKADSRIFGVLPNYATVE